MLKKLIPALFIVVLLASCSTMRPVNSTANKQQSSPAQTTANPAAKNVKFLDDISVNPTGSSTTGNTTTTKGNNTATNTQSDIDLYLNKKTSSIENASALQLKYAVLLNTDVEQLQDTKLLEAVDEWYGTRYRMGGTTKKGIDCSAFVQAVYMTSYATTVPRTAREQYKASRIISATELKEGDLVFFNVNGARGGISHVGIYLRNNKFVHASASQGVTVSDLFDPYYLKKYIGAGRIEKPEAGTN